MSDENTIISIGLTPAFVQEWFFFEAQKRSRVASDPRFYVAETARSIPRLLERPVSTCVGVLASTTVLRRSWAEESMRASYPTHVIDTSGVYMPGVGTPTILLLRIGGELPPMKTRIVTGLKGEPETPSSPNEGRVWSAIRQHFDDAVYRDEWIDVRDCPTNAWLTHFRERQYEEELAWMMRMRGGKWTPSDAEIQQLRAAHTLSASSAPVVVPRTFRVLKGGEQ